MQSSAFVFTKPTLPSQVASRCVEALPMCDLHRRRADILTQLLVGGVEPNPGPRSRSADPVTTLKVSAMLMDVDEYEGRVHKARHRVTYTDRDSPFLEDRRGAQWTYQSKTPAKLKAPMSKFRALLDRYETAVNNGDRHAAKKEAAQGKAWAEQYPDSVFAEIAPASSWHSMSRAAFESPDTAISWCDSMWDQYNEMHQRLNLPALEDVRAADRVTSEDYDALVRKNDELNNDLSWERSEAAKMKRWWLDELAEKRKLEADLKRARAEAGSLEQQVQTAHASLFNAATTRAAAATERESLAAKVAQMTEALDNTTEWVAGRERATQQLQADLESSRETVSKLEKALNTACDANIIFADANAAAANQCEALRAHIAELNEACKNAESRAEASARAKQQTETEMQQLRDRTKRLEEELQIARGSNALFAGANATTLKQCEALKAQVALLKASNEHTETAPAPAPAVTNTEAAQAELVRSLTAKLSMAHESVFSLEAQLSSTHTELDHVRAQLRATREQLAVLRHQQPQKPPAACTANPFCVPPAVPSRAGPENTADSSLSDSERPAPKPKRATVRRY